MNTQDPRHRLQATADAHWDKYLSTGLCECGCGQRTRVAAKTDRSKRWVKGQPLRFVNGHNVPHVGPRTDLAGQYIEEGRGYSTPCWIWQRYIDEEGYGRVGYGIGSRRAHRRFYEAAVAPVPEGLELDHLCRVRCCVNPDHLEPVTRAVNQQRGAKAKLTPEQAGEVRRLAMHSGLTQAAIASRFGIGQTHVSKIKLGGSWAEIT